MNDVITFIVENDIGKYLENVKMSNYTTYKVGGIASVLVYPKNSKKLVKLLRYIRDNNILYKVLGNGSNTLFSDKEFYGVIIKLDNFDNIEFLDTIVKAGAGVNLMRISNLTIKMGLSGLEFATGIPGSVGGAVFMNAGAYKSDMGYVVKSVKVLTPKFEIITMTNKELDFHYRTSFLQKNRDYICLEATFQLKKGNKQEMQELVIDRRNRRINSQPLEYPSAGSVFRNPDVDNPAGKIIEELGYKGLTKGGAQISKKHANFIINLGDAKASDIKELIEFVQERVEESYNIKLKVEQEFVNWE